MPQNPSSWLRISLVVDPELAEAVSEVLARHIPGGIAIESTAVEASLEDEGRAVGPLRVTGYIPVDEQLETTRLQIEQGLRYLSMIQPVPQPTYETIHSQNWMEAWKQHYRPLEVGEHLLILPAWMPPPPGDRIPICIEPGMAFGTGVHPTTQLILQLLEKYVKPGDSLIDVGCGSAILAIAAAKLGAAPVVAVDIDAQALENARHNAGLNDVQIEIGQGSVAELLEGEFSLRHADIVVANILAPVLSRLLDKGLAQLLKPGGSLILSGILAEQEGSVLQAVEAANLHVLDKVQIEDWIGLAAGPIELP
ncbi:MAG: 50S ribosomal protein L11 methyltransferase [Anaerolineales bacterium]